jgi:hypothetical protein
VPDRRSWNQSDVEERKIESADARSPSVLWRRDEMDALIIDCECASRDFVCRVWLPEGCDRAEL